MVPLDWSVEGHVMQSVDRDEQIRFMEMLEQRLERYAQSWLANPEYRAALHRYDHERDQPPLRRVAR
jgi:hypothetical protein